MYVHQFRKQFKLIKCQKAFSVAALEVIFYNNDEHKFKYENYSVNIIICSLTGEITHIDIESSFESANINIVAVKSNFQSIYVCSYLNTNIKDRTFDIMLVQFSVWTDRN